MKRTKKNLSDCSMESTVTTKPTAEIDVKVKKFILVMSP